MLLHWFITGDNKDIDVEGKRIIDTFSDEYVCKVLHQQPQKAKLEVLQ